MGKVTELLGALQRTFNVFDTFSASVYRNNIVYYKATEHYPQTDAEGNPTKEFTLLPETQPSGLFGTWTPAYWVMHTDDEERFVQLMQENGYEPRDLQVFFDEQEQLHKERRQRNSDDKTGA